MRRCAALAFVVLVACGSPQAAETPRARPTLVAGTSGEYPPLSLWRGDRVEGYAPALASAFAAHDGDELRFARFRWPSLTDDLRAHRFAIAADGITVRPERSIAGRFSVPIARGGAILLVRRPAWAEDLAIGALDRKELRVAVNQGGHLERVARATFHAADVRALPENGAVREALARGDVDAVMTNTFEAPRWAAGLSGIDRVGPITSDVTALWLDAGDAALAERLDDWLLDEEASGELEGLRKQWLGEGAGPRTATPIAALLAATSERLALMPYVAAAKHESGKEVVDVAQEERVLAASAEAVAQAAAKRHLSPPSRDATTAFFRAQIEAAKAVQRSAPLPKATFSLADDLRPAIARITARMAYLVVRVPRGPEEDALAAARLWLAESGLEGAQVEAIARAIAALR